jgi:hypothetical protein
MCCVFMQRIEEKIDESDENVSKEVSDKETVCSVVDNVKSILKQYSRKRKE